MTTLADYLRTVEWYDNHKLSMILNCPRKAFYHLYHEGGLEMTVGPGADFGWCIHKALDVYYTLYGMDEHKRRLRMYRAFDEAWTKKFQNQVEVQTKHRLEQGLKILASYAEKYFIEDQFIRPIETELGGMVRVEPQPGDRPDFVDSFMFLFRVDGVFERTSSSDWIIKEVKTTGSGVDRELSRREIDRQSLGYFWCLSQFENSRPIMGVMFDILLVAAQKIEFKRDFFRYDSVKAASWRRQTVNIVQDWRNRCVAAAMASTVPEKLDWFVQNDNECTSYGLCPYHKLCKVNPWFGVESYGKNTWIPLE